MKNKDVGSLFCYAALFTINFIVVLYCQYLTITDRLLVHLDACTYAFPVYHLKDTSLFRSDILTAYALSFIPKGYATLFTFLYPPLVWFKFLPFLLTSFSVLFIFKIARFISGRIGGFIAALLFIMHSWTFHTFQGTSPRAFAYPFFLPFLYFLITDKIYLSFLFYMLQIMFYPPMALISLFSSLCSYLVKLKKGETDIRRVIFAAMLFISPLFIYFSVQFLTAEGSFGRVVDLKKMIEMQEFHQFGREPFFFTSFLSFLNSPLAGLDLAKNSFLLNCAAILLFLNYFKKSKKIFYPQQIICVFLSSVLLYFMAYIFLLKLFFPSRYLIFTIPLMLYFLIASLFTNFYTVLTSRFARNSAMAALLIFIISFYSTRISGRLTDYRHLKNALLYLSSVPKDSTIAAMPATSDPIPSFARRRVLFSERFLLPVNMGYYDLMKHRVYDFLNAYYSPSLDEIRKFCKKYSVDYIVINKSYFQNTALNKWMEHEPYYSHIIDLTRNKNRGDYALLNIGKSKIVFEEKDISIIRTSDI